MALAVRKPGQEPAEEDNAGGNREDRAAMNYTGHARGGIEKREQQQGPQCVAEPARVQDFVPTGLIGQVRVVRAADACLEERAQTDVEVRRLDDVVHEP